MDARHLWQLTTESTRSADGDEATETSSLLDAGPIGFKVWWTTHGGARPLDRGVAGQPAPAGSWN